MTRSLALFLLAGFIWLGWYSYHAPVGYSRADIARVNALAAPHWRTKQAEALADVYGLTVADIDKPMNLWGAIQ